MRRATKAERDADAMDRRLIEAAECVLAKPATTLRLRATQNADRAKRLALKRIAERKEARAMDMPAVGAEPGAIPEKSTPLKRCRAFKEAIQNAYALRYEDGGQAYKAACEAYFKQLPEYVRNTLSAENTVTYLLISIWGLERGMPEHLPEDYVCDESTLSPAMRYGLYGPETEEPFHSEPAPEPLPMPAPITVAPPKPAPEPGPWWLVNGVDIR